MILGDLRIKGHDANQWPLLMAMLNKTAIDANAMAIEDGDAANKTAIDANAMAITDGDAANKTAIDANAMAITDGDAANKTAIDANGHYRWRCCK